MIDTFKSYHDDGEARLIKERILIMAALMLLVFLLLTARLFYIQIIQHEHFTTLSAQNSLKILPVPPIRGMLFDRNNNLLAGHKITRILELVPEEIHDFQQILQSLAIIIPISEADNERFLTTWQQRKNNFDKLPIKSQLTETEAAKFAVNQHLFPGVYINTYLERYYPAGAAMAHIIGYMSKISGGDIPPEAEANYKGTTHIGKTGLEKSYEPLLHGQTGYQQVEVDAVGRIVRVLEKTSPTKGSDLHLTIDLPLQKLAMSAMHGKRGAIVAMEPHTGEILALVSSPSFDPNSFVRGLQTADYQTMLDTASKPLFNRAINGTYPPGSTIKPFVALAALASGTRNISEQTWCPGWYKLPGNTLIYRDWKEHGHGQTNIKKAIVESCDVFFYTLANDLGLEVMQHHLAQFGFGQRTGITFDSEAAGLLPSHAWKKKTHGSIIFPGEIIILGIGQGAFLVTPLQLAKAVSLLANRGQAITPYIVQSANKQQLKNAPPNKSFMPYTDEHWTQIIEAMTDVVHAHNGTAKRSGLGANYRFAGKTGTAQVFSMARDSKYNAAETLKELHDHALFIAFAPVNDPKIAVAIIVENGGKGSTHAAPIARRLFDQYLLQGNKQS